MLARSLLSKGVMRSPDPTLAEYAEIDREVFRIRRKLVVLYGVVIACGVATLERCLHGIAVAQRARFLVLWAGVFGLSVASFALTRPLRTRLDKLFARTRAIASRTRRS